MPPTTQQQTQQHALSQAEHAAQQLGAAYGLPANIDWAALLPLILQCLQILFGGGKPPTP